MSYIRVSKNSQLRNFHNRSYAGMLTRTYNPSQLLTTAAMSGGNPASAVGGTGSGSSTPLAVYLPGFSQIGDPRSSGANGSGYFTLSGASLGKNGSGLSGLLGAPSGNGSSSNSINIGGNSYGVSGAPQVGPSDPYLALLLPIALLGFVLWLLFK